MALKVNSKAAPYLKLFAANIIYATLYFLIASDLVEKAHQQTLAADFFQVQATFQIISFCCFLAVRHVARFYQDLSLWESLLRQLPFVVPASLVGLVLAGGFQVVVYDIELKGGALQFAAAIPPVLVITLVISFVQALLEQNNFKRRVEGKKREAAGDGEESRGSLQKGLAFKSEERYYSVDYERILYLSADNKITYIHTTERAFKTTGLLKNFAEKLNSQGFFRIHKSFVVNLDFISHLEYFIGGAYLAHMKDDEETVLPVGRSFAKELKQKLGH